MTRRRRWTPMCVPSWNGCAERIRRCGPIARVFSSPQRLIPRADPHPGARHEFTPARNMGRSTRTVTLMYRRRYVRALMPD